MDMETALAAAAAAPLNSDERRQIMKRVYYLRAKANRTPEKRARINELARAAHNDPARIEASRKYKREGMARRKAENPALRDRINAKYRQRYHKAIEQVWHRRRDRVAALVDAFKQKISVDGHCSFPGCTWDWRFCGVRHIRLETKTIDIGKCKSQGMLDDEITRNTDEDGTLLLELLCTVHHRIRLGLRELSDRPLNPTKVAILAEWQSEQGACQMCGLEVGKIPSFCFDADHIDRSTKVDVICKILGYEYSVQSLRDELPKCRLLCANCHRVHTIKQMGYRHAADVHLAQNCKLSQ